MRIQLALLILVQLACVWGAEEPVVPFYVYELTNEKSEVKHLNRILEQIATPEIKSLPLSAKAANLTEALKLLKEVRPGLTFFAGVEYGDWLIFSTTRMGKQDDARKIDFQMRFHNGYAIKRGTDAAYSFGFW